MLCCSRLPLRMLCRGSPPKGAELARSVASACSAASSFRVSADALPPRMSAYVRSPKLVTAACTKEQHPNDPCTLKVFQIRSIACLQLASA